MCVCVLVCVYATLAHMQVDRTGALDGVAMGKDEDADFWKSQAGRPIRAGPSWRVRTDLKGPSGQTPRQ